MDVEENYLICKAKLAQSTDPYAAKAWILTAKTLYANNFGVQFEAYLIEKAANNYEEAAKCLSYIVMTFQNQPPELWKEVTQLTSALRILEGGTTSEQEFYVKMFQHISYEVQHKILLLTVNHSDNNLDHCKLMLLLLKRFPQTIQTHSPRLLETIMQGIANNHNQFREILIVEALPLISTNPPELASKLVNRMMAICFEYYITQMFKETSDSSSINEYWTKIFEILDLCGRILKWEPFLPYNRNMSKDIYWQRLILIVSSTPPRPSENKQILFCATILFVMSLQEYMKSVKTKVDDFELDYALVEGFKDNDSKRRKADAILEPPKITVFYPCNPGVSVCFVTASQCWQLMHSNDILQIDFGQLLMNLPMTVKSWLNRFLVDLAVYLGRGDEALNILKDTKLSNLEKNLRNLSLTISQPTFNIQSFDFLMKILNEMPSYSGQWVKNLSVNCPGRHLLVLPMSRRAIIQYCTKILVTALKPTLKLDIYDYRYDVFEPNYIDFNMTKLRPTGHIIYLNVLRDNIDLYGSASIHYEDAKNQFTTEFINKTISVCRLYHDSRYEPFLKLLHRIAVELSPDYINKCPIKKQKVMTDPSCTDSLLGNLLVLLQLDWPEEQPLAEYIFNIIQTKGHFIYLQFTNYIICVDMIEQFMSMWYSHGGDVHLEFSPSQANLPSKRIGTRGADKGVKDDFKQIIKQQILKCNDDIESLIQHFITQEHMRLVQNIFEK